MALSLIGLASGLILASCSDSSSIPGYDDLIRQVEQGPVGRDADHWIEMSNLPGEWERVGLIFGYIDDYAECLKAVEGLKRANPARAYRCVPANGAGA